MSDVKAQFPSVFLSSVFMEEIDGHWQYLPLRQKIIELQDQLHIRLWAYDLFWPNGSREPNPDADTIIDRCFAGIRDCDLFVFLLTKRHGTGVEYVKDRVLTSYLEMELFAAAMLQKPVVVLHEHGYEPEPALQDTLKFLQGIFRMDDYITGNAEQLCEKFREKCRQLADPYRVTSVKGIAALPDYLSWRRSKPKLNDELNEPYLYFLGSNLSSSSNEANPEKAQIILNQVASGRRGNETTPQVMPHGAALFRVWAAMRELMDRNNTTLNSPELAQLWDRAFGLWASHSSWFGLHGHLWMGPLAAIQMQTALRRKFAEESRFKHATDVREPVGARASAIYSIAKMMQSRSQKVRQFRLACKLATQAIDSDPDSSHGARLIRGYSSLQLSRLGYVWKIWEAQNDFRSALELREQRGAPKASVGEAKVALGFSLFSAGRVNSGLQLVKEGVDLMEDDPSPNGVAHLARSLRTLEQIARFTGQRELADDARDKRLKLAAKIEAFDQMRE